ncbi:hypothetical protein SB781_03285 [Paraburkholderia sp. SIMBA_061]
MRAYWRDARDPAIVLEEKQNQTCLGCEELQTSRWSGRRKYVCSLGVQKASTDIYEMQRCKKYSDGVTMTLDQSQQIEELLLTWYRWQIRQSHAETLAHFYRPEDRTCRGYVTPCSLDEDDETAYQWADDRQSEQVQLCVDMLAPEQRAAISTSMRNKESGRAVWSSCRVGDQHAQYQAAKERILPMLLSRQLVKPVQPV